MSQQQASISTRCIALFRKLVTYLVEFNLFPSVPPTTDPYDLQTERLSTRVFIVALVFPLIILILYTSIIVTTQIITVPTPTVDQYYRLHARYPTSLVCPCTQVSIEHKAFVEIQYRLHQVCSSSFVDDRWIAFIKIHDRALPLTDFRVLGGQSFQALRAICQLVKDTIDTSLKQLYSGSYISALVAPIELLQSQVDVSIRELISSTTSSLLSSLTMIRDTTQANSLFSALQTNYGLAAANQFVYLSNVWLTYDDECTCAYSSTCITGMQIFLDDQSSTSWDVPGFYVGCFVVEALRQSDLRCFYNQSCLHDLLDYMQTTSSITVDSLNSSSQSRFTTETPIGMIIDQLMVEEWNWTVHHDNYYAVCQPIECRYTFEGRNNLMSILTTVISVVGGLITVLKLAVPPFVWALRWVWKHVKQSEHRPSPPMREYPRIVLRHLVKWNLFPSDPPATELFDLQTQLYSTRLFCWLLAVCLFAILLYTSSVANIKTLTVSTPSLDHYQDLYSHSSQTLSCPCRNLSISYKTFTNINYSLHQVCESAFVGDLWIDYFRDAFQQSFQVIDFRLIGLQQFQALRSLCELVSNTIQSHLERFLLINYVSDGVSPKELLQNQLDTNIGRFLGSIKRTFALSMQLIRDTTHTNGLLSAYMTNYGLFIPPNTNIVATVFVQYDNNCSCLFNATCNSKSRIYRYANGPSIWYVPGFYHGCFILESLRQSHLGCFYNQSCLLDLVHQMNPTASLQIDALDPSRSRRFDQTTSVGMIVDELMLEEWNWTLDYTAYFDGCHPSECTYTVIETNDAVYVVTLLIGLLGGLLNVLRFLVPRCVRFIRTWIKRRRSPAGPRATGRWRSLPKKLLCFLIDFNIFPSSPPATDPYDLRTQRISTRVFLWFLFVLLFDLLLYNSAIINIKTITVDSPDLNDYYEYYSQHSQTLSCPCTQISTTYKTFLNLHYSLHSVCYSQFITDRWFQYLQRSVRGRFPTRDFRYIGLRQFQAIGSLCHLAQETIDDSLVQFGARHLVSDSVVPESLFRAEFDAHIRLFISSTNSSFLRSLRTIRDTTQANALFSALLTNYYFTRSADWSTLHLHPLWYGDDCFCIYRTDCVTALEIYPNSTLSSSWPVVGLYRGCVVLEALRQSRLECFYNQSCLVDIARNLMNDPSIPFSALNASLSRRFSPNATFGEILDQFMVNEWNWTISHSSYFAACKPSACSYTIFARNDAMYVVTKVISLLGGLITCLKLMVPKSISLIRKFWKRRTRVVPHPSNTDQQTDSSL